MEGFHHSDVQIPTVMQCLRDGGYTTGILGKLGHSTPHASYRWDMQYDMDELGKGRSPELYAKYAREFIKKAAQSGKPFYLMANSHDPHRPFHGSNQEQNAWPDAVLRPPSRVYAPEEVEVPGFLPDIPDVRLELAEYFSSVGRCDDTVGAIMAALEEANCSDNTLVMFLSDNGMAFPFAKTNCYLHSTKTPWIVRWPDKIAPGQVDKRHFISGIDFLPTVMEACGLPPVPDTDGTSFLPLLLEAKQSGRDCVFTQFHETAGVKRYPMRCVQNSQFGYIFNPWSDGERLFRNESQSGRTFEAMRKAAESDVKIAQRVELFLHRVPEELYDVQDDPDAQYNLIDNPDYAEVADRMRGKLRDWMKCVNDPALETLKSDGPNHGVVAFMADQEAKAAVRLETRRQKRQNA